MTTDLADELERLALQERFSIVDVGVFVQDNLPAILSALRGERDAAGAAERDVGRYIYQRIDTLIGGASDELAWLAAVVGCVEEYGIEHCRGDELAPFPARGEQWQGIETAPEGVAVLIGGDWPDGDPWWAVGERMGNFWTTAANADPSRWMPLPPPPKGADG